MALPVPGYRLTAISSKAYEHPADRAATAATAFFKDAGQTVQESVTQLGDWLKRSDDSGD